MDPPSPLVTLAGAGRRRRGVPLVVDMHTVAFYAREWRLLRPLELPLLRAAAAVIVTNDALAAQVRGWGARAFVLPDPLPDAAAGVSTRRGARPRHRRGHLLEGRAAATSFPR